MRESTVLKDVQVHHTNMGGRVFRNNVALAWAGNLIKPMVRQTMIIEPGDVVLRNARPLHAGLCEGSSDLIGWTPILITPEMIGRTMAIFTAWEIKQMIQGAKVTLKQKSFIEAVTLAGGLGAVVRSEQDIETEIAKYRVRMVSGDVR